MKAASVRQTFLDFFAARAHEKVHSSSLVPENDPTLLFTNAGMNQFKDVFTGAETRSYRRATTSQKCVRAGGKHNDLDEVGRTPRHHTFFEMLGNFSFGDYFKEDAIAWAWELLTQTYGMDPGRLVITVFGGDPSLQLGADDEARAIWKRVTGFGDDRVIGLGMKDNFWMMGETGPMGPCSEIHYCMDGDRSRWPTTAPESWKGWLEIWNLVFMQFERRTPGGQMFPLPAPSIDTGAGLERVTSVLAGVSSNYDTDLFAPLIAEAASIAKVKYGAGGESDTSLRVIADHARCSAFLIADGVFPDKDSREYVLRRIFRRAVRHGKRLGIAEPFMHRVCAKVVEEMAGQYPELTQRKTVIAEVALEEERRFRATLDRGLELLEGEFTRMKASGETRVSGKATFLLYDTFGFPKDLTEVIAEERNFQVDHDGFEQELSGARERSRFGGSDQEAVSPIYKELASQYGASKFLGYDGTSGDGKVIAMVVGGARTTRAGAGTKIGFVCDQTPFYGAAGGQIGDLGTATSSRGATVRIDDTLKPHGDLIVHLGEITAGELEIGDRLSLVVDAERRNRTRANHSATHLLHLGLKKVLGDHVAQKGSLVGPDRLRFDFSHFSPMTDEQRRAVEDWVNAEVRANLDSSVEVLPIEQARQKGAVAMFGEKYGDQVRVVHIGGESLEFCGGTHVKRSGDIGLFKIVGESGVAQGVRRIEAVTGVGALDYLRRIEGELDRAGERLKVNPLEVAARLDKVLADARGLEKELDKLKQRLASGAGNRDLLGEVVEVKGVKVLAASTEVDDAKVLRDTGDQLRDRLGSGVLLLAGIGGADKVTLLAMVTKDLLGKVHAGKLLSVVAESLGGRGGGKPDMAQGGGRDAAKVPQALELARRWVGDQLT